MNELSEIRQRVHDSAKQRRLFTPHALRQMARPERMITTSEVRKVIESGKILEDYPNDPRGHSCLMLGFSDDNRPIHVVCSPKKEYCAIITAYLPNNNEWKEDYERRISS